MKNITLSNVNGTNIAVLHLETRPTLSNYIQPICLDNGQTFAEGLTCWVAGWNAQRGGGEPVQSPPQVCGLLPSTLDSASFLFVSLQTLEEQRLQEFQTRVVNCGNVSSEGSICTETFTLEQVRDTC